MYRKKLDSEENNKPTFGYSDTLNEVTYMTIGGMPCHKPYIPEMRILFRKRRLEERELVAIIAYMRGDNDRYKVESKSTTLRAFTITDELRNKLGLDGPQLQLFDNLDTQNDFLTMTKEAFMDKYPRITGMRYSSMTNKKNEWLAARSAYERQLHERHDNRCPAVK